MIDSYVVVAQNNALYNALINNCKESNMCHQCIGEAPQYDESVIKEYKSKIIDLKSKQEDIVASIIEVSNYNQDEILQLSILAREYIAIKQQNVHKKCFSDQENRQWLK